MKLQEMEQLLPKFEEELIIAKEFVYEGNSGMLLAVTRQDKSLAFWMLTSGKKTVKNNSKKKVVTNRMVMLEAIEDKKVNWYQQIRAVKARDKVMNISDVEVMAPDCVEAGQFILTHFLDSGIHPAKLKDTELDQLLLIKLKVQGVYKKIPLVKPELRKLSFEFQREVQVVPVKKKMKVAMGGNFPRKLSFKDPDSEIRHEFYIERVYLEDIRADQLALLEDPQFLAEIPEGEVENVKKGLLRAVDQICPKGKMIPVIEYETAENLTLEFYENEYLNAEYEEEEYNSQAELLLMVETEEEEGKHGMRLRACAMAAPVDPSTEEISVELLQYSFCGRKQEFKL